MTLLSTEVSFILSEFVCKRATGAPKDVFEVWYYFLLNAAGSNLCNWIKFDANLFHVFGNCNVSLIERKECFEFL